MENSEKLATFMEISGLAQEAAVKVLSSKNWDLELCINEFLSENSAATSRAATSRASGIVPRHDPTNSSSWIMDLLGKLSTTFMYLLKMGIILILGKEQIKKLSDFSKKYEEEFGKVHPEFFQGTYTQALEAGKREAKWILIALYMKDHPGNKNFCKNVIGSSQLSSYIREKNGLFWMGDTQTEQGLQVLQVLSVTKHPFLAVVGPQNGRMVVFDRIQGILYGFIK
jgi:FAS-associated factor 2